MRWTTIVGLFVVAVAAPALGGVILTQQETHPGTSGAETITSTTMLDGNRQKSSNGKLTTIIDLDQGTMMTIDDASKTATVFPLATEGPGSMILAGLAASMNGLKPTGVQHTVAGYPCDEYKGTMNMFVEMSTTSCFSKTAPGAAEYAAFYRKMFDRMGPEAKAIKLPEGIALSSETSTKGPDLSAMPEQQRKMMAEAMGAQGPQVVRTQVTKIESASIPADAFAVPPGYTVSKLGE